MLKKPLLFITSVAVISMLFGLYSVYQYQKVAKELADIKSNPNKAQDFTNWQQKQIIDEVGKLVVLPTNEEPTVAAVSDASSLKSQAFFADAQNGDWVLVYNGAKLAILYRPGVKKVVKVAPINLAASPTPGVVSQSAPSPTPTPTGPTFLLRNGTSVIGLTKKYEIELLKKIPNSVVVDKENASKKDYATTILIDAKGDKSDQAVQFAKALGISVSPLPSGESAKPQDASASASFIIILGSDKK